jgi:hypothetical protein
VNHSFRALLLVAFQHHIEELSQIFDLAVRIVLQQTKAYLTITPETVIPYT